MYKLGQKVRFENKIWTIVAIRLIKAYRYRLSSVCDTKEKNDFNNFYTCFCDDIKQGDVIYTNDYSLWGNDARWVGEDEFQLVIENIE